MPSVKGMNLRALLDERYFGDGPPDWRVGRGRLWERPCDSAAEADEQRCAVVTKLNYYFNRDRRLPVAILRSKLRNCQVRRRCFSGACPVCIRALQRWFVETGYEIGDAMARMPGGRPRFISIVPDFGRVKRGALCDFDIMRFRQHTAAALRRAGIVAIHGAMDVSLNHWEGEREEGYFQFQWWGVVAEATRLQRNRLEATVNRSGEVRRPIFQTKRSWPRAALAYGVKKLFVRRESFLDRSVACRGRAPCIDTRNRDLLGAEWLELVLFLDSIGISRRLLMFGPDAGVRTRR